MKDTIAKLRALVDIKTHLLDVLGKDLATGKEINEQLIIRIRHLEAQNEVLRRQQGWWHEQDEALVEEAQILSAEDLVTKYEETEHTVVLPVSLVVNNDD